jgi:hypothetical protein
MLAYYSAPPQPFVFDAPASPPAATSTSATEAGAPSGSEAAVAAYLANTELYLIFPRFPGPVV